MQHAWKLVGVVGMLVLGGCGIGGNHDEQDKIDAAAVAVGSGVRWDDAISDATAALAMGPNAEAFYLRGQAEEERPKQDSSIEEADFDRAMKDYQAALDLKPGAELTALVQNGMANISYERGDYSGALLEYTLALDHLERATLRGPALYRIGVCQQRVGHFDNADMTFQEVMQEYPDTELAEKAKDHLGARSFYVKLGEYTKPADAANAITTADGVGVKARTEKRPDGVEVVVAGPYTFFDDAEKVRGQVAGEFPGAVVEP